MFEALQFEFMRNAMIAGLLAGVVCGMIGTLIVVNRIVFLSGGIAHAAYGGIGLAFFFGVPYTVGTVGFSIVTAMVMAVVTLAIWVTMGRPVLFRQAPAVQWSSGLTSM